MKTLGWLLVFAGSVITYAGWKNEPILSVVGFPNASANVTGNSIGTLGNMQNSEPANAASGNTITSSGGPVTPLPGGITQSPVGGR